MMLSSPSNEFRQTSRSKIACYVCRKRKIRCGRELPHCVICRETEQQCTYPVRAMRPGPKIGSTHTSSRKRQASDAKHYEKRGKARTDCFGSDNNESPHTRIQQVVSSPVESPTTNTPLSTDILNLSFIIHPCHDSCSPTQDETVSHSEHRSHQDRSLAKSCRYLGLAPNHLSILIQRYFDVFTSFQLFRVPHFYAKLHTISSASQSTSLLAAIVAFAVKDLNYNDINTLLQADVLNQEHGNPSIHYRALALKHMEDAITECGDEPFSLPLFQALILNTHCLLVQGVRGRAWRYLGLCIRSAYELNLHCIDSGKSQACYGEVEAEQWCVDEEWRRAWWAIWEMDVFASVIRRCPAGIDWSQNETFLPVRDDKWFHGTSQASCFLDLNLVSRWKSVAAIESQSPKAWFIVINSLMKDAQNISSPIGASKEADRSSYRTGKPVTSPSNNSRMSETERTTDSVARLNAVLDSLHCATMALPKELRYHGQYLSFGGRHMDSNDLSARRLLQSNIYSIHIMTQLTRLMVYKYHIFRMGMRWPSLAPRESNSLNEATVPPTPPMDSSVSSSLLDSQNLERYFEAADSTVALIRGTSDDHFKYVNPFVASTAWLAGAVQLLHRGLLPHDTVEKDLISSNFELLSLTYGRFVEYWNMSTIPLKNWEILEGGLEKIKYEAGRGEPNGHGRPCLTPADSGSSQVPSIRDEINLTAFRSRICPPLKRTSGFADTLQPHSGGSMHLEMASENFNNGCNPTFHCATTRGHPGANTIPTRSDHSEDNHDQRSLTRMSQPRDFARDFHIAPMVNRQPNPISRQVPSFANTEGYTTFLPELVDVMPFEKNSQWDLNPEITDYLDEMLSVSYFP